MAISLRLKRMGKHKAAFYRIVAADDRRSAKSGPYVEEIGYYNPSRNPAVIRMDKDKAHKWIKRGARVSDTVKAILKQLDMYDPALFTKTKKKKKAKAAK